MVETLFSPRETQLPSTLPFGCNIKYAMLGKYDFGVHAELYYGIDVISQDIRLCFVFFVCGLRHAIYVVIWNLDVCMATPAIPNAKGSSLLSIC